MDVLSELLFWIHLASLGLAGAAVFAIPVIGARLSTATAETRPLLFGIINRLSTLGRAAVGLLIITGPLLFWRAWNFSAPNAAWFGIKMLLVVILLVIIIVGGINGARAQKGDRTAAGRAPMFGIASIVAFLAIVLSAVFAFS